MSPQPRDEDPDERAARARGEAADVGPDAGPDAPTASSVGPDEAAPVPETDSHDALWQQIVANYGERPQWQDPRPHPEHPAGSRRPSAYELSSYRDSEPESDLERGPGERYRPPSPPPFAWARPPRLIAWFGIFGVPTVVLIALVAGVVIPPTLGVLLMFWFVGGFAYLVASMRPHHDDPDDGAVL